MAINLTPPPKRAQKAKLGTQRVPRAVPKSVAESILSEAADDPTPFRMGPKPSAGGRRQEWVDYDEARARNEKAKADLNELELAVRKGVYVTRAAVQQATSTALASLCQTLRSVPDNLERRLGVSPEVAQEVGALIDAALDDLATEFEQVHGVSEAAVEASPEVRYVDA